MTGKTTWRRIETLLDELLELPRDERQARIAALDGPDAKLRARLEELLAAEDEGTDGILDHGIGPLAGRVLDDEVDDAAPEAGTRIGPFRVVRELGRGGMGEVLLAERAEGDFEQLVALKIVREGLGRGEITDRFRYERRILARLQHPNIAALHDGGATDEGVPYFAMEYVEGERIDAWCDGRKLDVGARLDLFDAVCRAVDHAHRNLVVHRDLKPSNVLVTSDGTVKLLDFGIAKLVEPDADVAGGAEATQRTGRFLTPAYAAPEQVLGEPTSTATDVYALGVLLYVLLTGHNPHGDTSRSVEVARAIVDGDTPAPSTVAGRDSPTSTGERIARMRGLDPSELRRRLRGDLDNILGKALRRRPEDRYASAEDLRADLERHRKSLPVAARPATRGYRLRKFVRRHRVGVAAGAVASVSLLAAFAGIAWQAGIAAKERDEARAVKDFLIGMFAAANPEFESGETMDAVELVQHGAASVTERFGDQPAIRAEVNRVLGTVLSSLAEYDRADTVLHAALADYRALDNTDGAAETLVEIGNVARWQGRYDDAAARAEEALALLRERHRRDPFGVAHALSLLGAARMHQGRNDDAAAALREAIAIVRRTRPDEPGAAGEHLESLASVERERGNLEQAELHQREAIALHRADGDRFATARALAALGDVLDDMDRNAEAVEVLREGVAVLREEYGAEGHPQLAMALSNLGGALRDTNPEEAMALQREMVPMFRKHLGDEHMYVARAMNNLSLTVARSGDHEEATRILTESVAVMKRAVGEGHPAVMLPLCNLANRLADLERYDEAEARAREAIAIAEEHFAGHYEHSHPLASLANILRLRERFAESERVIRRAWDVRRELLGPQHSKTVWARREHAGALDRIGQTEAALAEYANAIRDAREGMPATAAELARALHERALLGERLREPRDGLLALLTEAGELRKERYGEDHASTLETHEALERITGFR